MEVSIKDIEFCSLIETWECKRQFEAEGRLAKLPLYLRRVT
jgi:hypothetical protein